MERSFSNLDEAAKAGQALDLLQIYGGSGLGEDERGLGEAAWAGGSSTIRDDL